MPVQQHDPSQRALDVARAAEESYHFHRASLLHQELEQLLAAIRLHLVSLHHECAGAAELTHSVDLVDDLVGQAFVLMRRIAIELYPLEQEDKDLLYSLHSLARSFSEQYGISCQVIVDKDHTELNEELRLAAFRIAQNTVEYIAHYTDAPAIMIKFCHEGDNLKLSFYGFSVRQARASGEDRALKHIRRQVKQLQGRFRLLRRSGQGKRIDISLPLHRRTLQ